jgi:phosphatidylinositol 4-kinase
MESSSAFQVSNFDKTAIKLMIVDAASRQELLKQSEMTLFDLYKFKYGDKSDPLFQEKRRNYIKSMAAYSLVLYILQIKDRHNGNIMIDKEGNLLHIDFGFMFESSPGGNMGFEPDMKLTQDLISLMGGSMDTEGNYLKSR